MCNWNKSESCRWVGCVVALRRRRCSLLSSAVHCSCEAGGCFEGSADGGGWCTGVCRGGEGGAGGGAGGGGGGGVTGYLLMRGFQMSLMSYCPIVSFSLAWTLPAQTTDLYLLNGSSHIPIHYTLRTKRLYCLTVHHVFAKLGKMFAFTKWKNYGGGLDEMDIMK